jgi:hypothetical protein
MMAVMVRVAREDRALRPFWLHQAAEYLIGLVLVAQGLQSPTPVVPALAGGLVVANAAMTEGPLGAFRLVPRTVHRWIDLGVIVVLVLVAAVPALDIDNATRLLLVLVGAVLAFVWWNSSFAAPAPRPPGEVVDRGEAVGRFAGRAVGNTVKGARRPRR